MSYESVIIGVLRKHGQAEILQNNPALNAANLAHREWTLSVLRSHQFSLHRLIDTMMSEILITSWDGIQ
jgi:hypothetical protein